MWGEICNIESMGEFLCFGRLARLFDALEKWGEREPPDRPLLQDGLREEHRAQRWIKHHSQNR